MAGKNFTMKEGQVLFRQGDKSDGMYLIRSGDLQVYLESGKGADEIVLATVNQGGMIGEMALFDQQPRSASVKALTKAEITHISNSDFVALMKQIPKWFTALMGTLSGRLRVTNDRLKKLEGNGGGVSKGEKVRMIIRVLGLIEIILAVDGVKEGKGYILDCAHLKQKMYQLTADSQKEIEQCLDALVAIELIVVKTNAKKISMLTVEDRGALKRLHKFMAEFETVSGKPCLGKVGSQVLKIAVALAEDIAYDPLTLPYNYIVSDAKKRGLPGFEDGPNILNLIAKAHKGDFSVVKTSDGGIGIKAEKKSLKNLAKMHGKVQKLISSLLV